MEQWRAERNKALMTLDMEWAQKRMPGASNDHVRLMAMLHKVRYECTDLDDSARHTSGEWLRQHGYGRMTGEPLLQEGALPV